MLTLLLPYLAFGVFLAVNAIAGYSVSQFLVYVGVIMAMIAATFASKGNPARMLLYFALCGIAALLIGMFTTGWTSVIAFISVGLFCSTMWPCIFTLAITGPVSYTHLDVYKRQVSTRVLPEPAPASTR